MSPARSLRVWDLLVRLMHWALVAAVAVAWLSTQHIGIPASWHEPAGYGALSVVVLRLIWGWVGSPQARFAHFVRGPRLTWAYARAVLSRTDARHIGHNPLGAWMVLALLACVGGITTTGWLQTTDRYWGSEALENMHTTLAWLLLGLAALHVAGVGLTSRHHRENLVLAMLDGRKRPPSRDDVM